MSSPVGSASTTPQLEQRPCVLIVDGDKVSQRAIELALSSNKYVIEWARDGEAAFDIMRRMRVDVVIADSLLTDLPGITLMRRTFELCGPGAPTFLFVSADRANTTRIGLLMTGAHDYLGKPFVPEELKVRVQNIIESKRRARADGVRGITGLAGDASQVPIPDILTMLELTRKTGTLRVSVGHATGMIALVEGRLTHAEIGNLVGQEAFFVLLQYHGGVYRFEPGMPDSRQTIDQRVSEMLLASAVREDSARNERNTGPILVESTITNTSPSLRELGIEKRSIDLRTRTTSESKPPPLRELTARLGIALADPYLLGDLVLAHEIPEKPTQFRIELWCALAEGVSALLGLASAPGFDLLVGALDPKVRRLHLQLEAPTATVIVTLVDLEGESQPPQIAPHGVVLIPPRGELVALAPHRLAEVTARMEIAHRPVMVGIGGPALHTAMTSVVDETHGPRYLGMPGRLDDGRDVFGGLIRLWNASR